MPLKIRCKGCEKVLNLPDRVRGKAIKCPECQTVLRVPAGKSAAQQKRAPQPVPEMGDDEEFLANMDLRRAVDRRVRVCVKCGEEIDDEDVIDCPMCGHNVDTGIMSAAQRKRRSRRGPDPDEYWGVAWTGSLAFVRDNLPLVFRTAGYWVLFLTLAVYSMLWLGLLVARGSGVEPMVFFGGLILVLISGCAGWYWHACIRVVRHTMSPKRDKPMQRVQFDFFECIALGFKAMVWPVVLLLPVLFVTWLAIGIPMAVSGSTVVPYTMLSIIDFVVRIVTLLVFPLAMVHMTMPYTYKAWTPYHMAIALGKNILPALYYFVLTLAALLPFVITTLIIHLVWDGGIAGFAFDMTVMVFDLVDGFFELISFKPPSDAHFARAWYWFLMVATVSIIPIALIFTPFCIAGAFGAVFLMRANGYVGLYFEDKLDLVKETEPNVPCGFWPRYLAALVDGLVLAIGALIIWVIVLVLMYLAFMTGLLYLIELLRWVYIFGVGVLFPMFYFAKPQSGPGIQASVGKIALGIIVLNEEGKNMSFEAAIGRFFLKLIVSIVPLGVGCMMAGFTEGKLALHDTIMKTSVVWKGDDERDSLG